MSITPSLRASARAAYRDLYRASSTTFAGDELVLNAFRLKMRADALEAQTASDPAVYQEKNQLGHDIANVLRKNIVRGQRVKEAHAEEKDVWRIRLTKDSELGDNKTIKSASGFCAPCEANSRRARKEEKAVQNSADSEVDSSRPAAPRYYSQLKKAHQNRVSPELKEEDLDESFVRGSGPGGQSINKTSNNVQLIHKPTGIRVTCQTTRSLETNRKLARRILLEKLDKIENPGLSKGEVLQAKQNERERRRRKKAKKKTLAKERERLFGNSS